MTHEHKQKIIGTLGEAASRHAQRAAHPDLHTAAKQREGHKAHHMQDAIAVVQSLPTTPAPAS